MNYIRLGFLTIFHPIRAFELIKRNRTKYSILPFFALILTAIFVRSLYIYTVNYTVSDIRIVDANLLVEASKILIPLFAWLICSYLLMAIMSGEATLKESLLGGAYSLVPYIVFSPILIVLSQIISIDEVAIYNAFSSFIIVWVCVLLFVNIMISNNLGFLKSIGLTFLSVVSMLVLGAVLLIVMAIVVQVGFFVGEIINEFKIKS